MTRPGLEPGPLDSESSALTTIGHRVSHSKYSLVLIFNTIYFSLNLFRNNIFDYNKTRNSTDSKVAFVVPAFDGSRHVVSFAVFVNLGIILYGGLNKATITAEFYV